jgi:hypothetical protein
MINADDLMMIMIFSGIALCGAYFHSQFMNWRRQHTAEAETDVRDRLLYALPSQEKLIAVPAGDDKTGHREHRDSDR